MSPSFRIFPVINRVAGRPGGVASAGNREVAAVRRVVVHARVPRAVRGAGDGLSDSRQLGSATLVLGSGASNFNSAVPRSDLGKANHRIEV